MRSGVTPTRGGSSIIPCDVSPLKLSTTVFFSRTNVHRGRGGRRGEGEGRGGKGLSAAGSRNAATARDRIRAPLSRSRNAHIAGLACSQTDQRRRTCNRGGLRPTPGVHNNNNDNSRVKFNLLASRDA